MEKVAVVGERAGSLWSFALTHIPVGVVYQSKLHLVFFYRCRKNISAALSAGILDVQSFYLQYDLDRNRVLSIDKETVTVWEQKD